MGHVETSLNCVHFEGNQAQKSLATKILHIWILSHSVTLNRYYGYDIQAIRVPGMDILCHIFSAQHCTDRCERSSCKEKTVKKLQELHSTDHIHCAGICIIFLTDTWHLWGNLQEFIIRCCLHHRIHISGNRSDLLLAYHNDHIYL